MKTLINTLIVLTLACGLTPLKPIPPIGCKDLVSVCVCDADGNNCYWQWQCI